MIINSVKISNFKNFEDVEVKLGKMNVLVGANASGKTNFIEALKFLRNLKNYGLENAISLSGGAEFFQNLSLKNENKVTKIEVGFSLKIEKRLIERKHHFAYLRYKNAVYSIEINKKIENNEYVILQEQVVYKTEILSKYVNEFGAVETDETKTFSFEYMNKYKDGMLNFETSRIEKKINLKVADKLFELPLDYLYGFAFESKSNLAIKIGNELYPQELLDVMMKAKILFTKAKVSQYLLHELYWLDELNFAYFPIYDFDLKKAKQSTHITSKADLEENGENLSLVIKKILADKEKARSFSNLLSYALPFIKTVEMDNFYRQSVAFNVQEQHSEARFPSALLSDGTIAVTAIITALFFEKQPFMVFEEPEHGVHPALIAKLVQYFYDASEKKQIIITTHNPEIVKHIQKLEDLLLVSRNEKGFAQISRPIEQEMVKTFLKNELGIDELFTQNLLDF